MSQSRRAVALAEVRPLQAAHWPQQVGREVEYPVEVAALPEHHGRPDAIAETLRDGWLHTGDVGRLDGWGALHYLARTKEMIKTNGMSVFPHGWSRDNMAAYKVPEFEVVEQLPMTATGKVRKGDLFDRAEKLAHP